MPETVNQAYIFVPMIFVVLLTIFAFLKMGGARSRAMKEGVTMEYYRVHVGGSEPDYAIAASRHYGNLFEMPVLFYAACISAYVLSAVSLWTVLFAWGYVIMRVIQSLVHLTSNNVMHRGMAFLFGTLFVIALWVNVALAVYTLL